MKIISKYKDYYDFLSGVYGEDPLLVLDRRESDPISIGENVKLMFYIAGIYFEGYCHNGKVYFGKDLYQFEDEKHKERRIRHEKISIKSRWWRDEETRVWILSNDGKRFDSYDTVLRVDDKKLNEKKNCPIIVKDRYDNVYKFPVLKDLFVNTLFSPDEIYKKIMEWLSARRTAAENQALPMTDTEKLLSKGFDKVTSFRPKIK